MAREITGGARRPRPGRGGRCAARAGTAAAAAGKALIVGASRQTGENDDEDHHLRRVASPQAGGASGSVRDGGLTGPDDAPAAPEHPVSQTGDLWLLGAKVTCPKCRKVTPLERAIRR